jgi:error-prone DNA polymerase
MRGRRRPKLRVHPATGAPESHSERSEESGFAGATQQDSSVVRWDGLGRNDGALGRESILTPSLAGIPSRLPRRPRGADATSAGETRVGKRRTRRSGATSAGEAPAATDPAYAELHCLSNFSFLRGASHPEEIVEQAAELGYTALAITDRNSLAGVVRAHVAAKEHNLHLIVGAEITPVDAPPVVLLAPDRAAYGRLARLITRGRLRCQKGECEIRLADVEELGRGLIAIVVPGERDQGIEGARDQGDGAVGRRQRRGGRARGEPEYAGHGGPALHVGHGGPTLHAYRDIFGADLYLAAELAYDVPDRVRLEQLVALSRETGIPLVAGNDVHYHVPERRYLQDVLTCIREKCTLATAGRRLFANAERHLRARDEIARRYAPYTEFLARTVEIARRCTFSLDELRYEYPHELVPEGQTAGRHLTQLTWAGARERYPDGIPDRVQRLVENELALIAELKYEHYFLTVWDLVRFARGQGILCQGRGSAANSAVCYCLGVTAVDPARIDLLFERFISKERNEPPDIDIDFEHERREEVFQYIYAKYGRERAAITAEVISYRPRSAVRDVGKALGLSLDRVDTLAKALEWWSDETVPEEAIRAAGLEPGDRTVQMLIRLVKQLLGFPRHLSQHVGGFVITETPLCEIVPLENGAMPDRTFIEWDKDDIDALGILKVDCLALGMLTAIDKCFGMVNRDGGTNLALHTIPPEEPQVYDLICAADTVGVFQIESRAQMSMLPRLRPRCFYDLVIEVAIVRPGPIQGGMIHPYLRRRDGREPVSYPSDAVRGVLEKTLGVPLFQEQVMRLAVVAAGFTAGEADQLRRSMAAWGRGGKMEQFQMRLMKGMLANGYPPAFAEQIFKQIRGFGEYGFPESHAASFALLVYVSAWLKRCHPAAFIGAVLNSQPMGFYAPAQLVRDAQRHGVSVLPVDVNCSRYDCALEGSSRPPCRPENAEDLAALDGRYGARPLHFQTAALRLGMRLVRGLSADKVRGIEAARREGVITSIHSLARRADVARETLLRLAAADAFRSLGLDRREALWQILALDDQPAPLFAELEPTEPPVKLPAMPLDETVVQDYDTLGLSLNAHPIGLVREALDTLHVSRNEALKSTRHGRRISVAGLVTHRQRPGTAKGIVFMTLEDESGTANLIIRPQVWERCRAVGRTKIAIIAEGAVERQGEVVHVQVTRLHDLSARIAPVRATSRDFH